MIDLRPHQSDALRAIVQAIKAGSGRAVGRIVMPTGAGKTFVEAATLAYQMQTKRRRRIHLVLAPRILLVNQLLEEYRRFLGTGFRAIAFHSGLHEPDYASGINWKEVATTRINTVKEHWQTARAADQDLIVFSTYHSAGKFIDDMDFDTVIADESQYCVGEEFFAVARDLEASVKLFFTATEKHTVSDRGRGLNNETVYGKQLYYISPARLIELGLIVPPRLHVMYASSAEADRTIVSEVMEIAAAQHAITSADLGFSKILFAMKGTDDVRVIQEGLAELRAKFPTHDVFTITSKTGARINGVKVDRELEFIPALKNSNNALIFHYDILSEGIDVDGITGVALLRNMGLAKLLQTIGRAVRVYKPNPALKRYALISVPVINGDEDDKENVGYYVQAIRNGGYDISAQDVVETGTPRHMADEENVDDAYTKARGSLAGLFVTDIFHDIETEELFSQVRGYTVDEFANLLSQE